MRVAIVHDWLTGMRGGEKVLEVLLDLYPDAEIYTLLHVPGSVSPRIEDRPIHASFVDRLPRAHQWYRYYLPLFPAAIERFDLSGYRLVLSASHCVAKGVRPPEGVPHLCYCLTPMRYVWDLYDDYFGPARAGPGVRWVMPHVARRLRRWDRQSSGRVRRFVTPSQHVRGKIERFYNRTASVVYPPVDLSGFPTTTVREEFYLIVSAFVPYKRLDLAVMAFNQLGRRLIVVGNGPEEGRLRRLAGPTVTFTGWLQDDEVKSYMSRCRAFIFPGEEEFGLTAVEAQAAGAPVIAYGSGGVTESVIGANGGADRGDATGIFFYPQTVDALVAAVQDVDSLEFRPEALARNVSRFHADAFRRGMRLEIEQMLNGDDRLAD